MIYNINKPALSQEEINLIDKTTMRDVADLKDSKVWWETKAIFQLSALSALYTSAYAISLIAIPTLGALAPLAALTAVFSAGFFAFLQTKQAQKWVQKKADEIEPKLNNLQAKIDQQKTDIFYDKIAKQYDTTTGGTATNTHQTITVNRQNLNQCTTTHINFVWQDFEAQSETMALKGGFRNTLKDITDIQRECSGISRSFESYYSHYTLFVNQDLENNGGVLSKQMKSLNNDYLQKLSALLSEDEVKANPMQTAYVMMAQSAVRNTYSIMKSHETALQKIERDHADRIRVDGQTAFEQITELHKNNKNNVNAQSAKATLSLAASASIIQLWADCKQRMANIAKECKFQVWNEEVKALSETCESYARLLGDRNTPATLGYEALFGENGKLTRPIENLKGAHREELLNLLNNEHVKKDPMKVAYIGLVLKAMSEMGAIFANYQNAYKLQEQTELEESGKREAQEQQHEHEIEKQRANEIAIKEKQRLADAERRAEELKLLLDNQNAVAPLLTQAIKDIIGGDLQATLQKMVAAAVQQNNNQ